MSTISFNLKRALALCLLEYTNIRKIFLMRHGNKVSLQKNSYLNKNLSPHRELSLKSFLW